MSSNQMVCFLPYDLIFHLKFSHVGVLSTKFVVNLFFVIQD